MEEKTINLLGIRKRMVICRTNTIKGNKAVTVIEPLSEEQENEMERISLYKGQIEYKPKDGVSILEKNIFLYGEIDLDNEEDIKLINKFNFIDECHSIENPNWIYSGFDYNTATCVTINNKLCGHPTWDNLTWFKYCYALIGKPKRIIVYKHPKMP